eukprot:7220797-Pyramimonas_sp.AAC.1
MALEQCRLESRRGRCVGNWEPTHQRVRDLEVPDLLGVAVKLQPLERLLEAGRSLSHWEVMVREVSEIEVRVGHAQANERHLHPLDACLL